MEFPSFPNAYALAGLFAKHNVQPTIASVGHVKDGQPCGCAVLVLGMEHCGLTYDKTYQDFYRQDGGCQTDMYDAVESHFGLENVGAITNGFDGVEIPKESIGKERDELAYRTAQECARLLKLPTYFDVYPEHRKETN